MSSKTLRSSDDLAFAREQFALRRIQVTVLAAGLLALSGTATCFALELGEATIGSGLGQRLHVQIPYRLAAAERLRPACVHLLPAARADALPTYSRVRRVAITPTHIAIFGDSPVLEPLIGLTVEIQCDATPHFVRSYELFVDPPARIPPILADDTLPNAAAQLRAEKPTVTAAGRSTAATAATATERANVSARARGRTGGPLTQGETYLVVRGDTLSGIAARVADRPATIRETADAILAANLDAFRRGDRDLIEAGRPITIPILAATTAALPAAPPAPGVAAAREAVPGAAMPLPLAKLPRAATSATSALRADATADGVPAESVEPPAAAVAVVRPSATPGPPPGEMTSEDTRLTTAGGTSIVLPALLVLGVAILSLVPWRLFVRRGQQGTPTPTDAPARSSQPRQLLDPAAGFDVIEGPPTELGSSAMAVPPRGPEAPAVSGAAFTEGLEPLARPIGATGSVDLDVGTPDADELVDWFEDRAAAAAAAPAAADATIDDEQLTLTIVELDLLRQDYEAEHTLTQEADKALSAAVADLESTRAARAASAETATLEIPQQPHDETIETGQTRRRRSSR